MADQASLRFQRSRILQTENLSASRNFERKGAISCVKDRRRGFFSSEPRESYPRQIPKYLSFRQVLLHISQISCCLSLAIAPSLKQDDHRILQELIQYGSSGSDIANELSPIFDEPIVCHDSGTELIVPHNEFEQDFPGAIRAAFQPHIINDQEITFQIFCEKCIFLFLFRILEFPNQIKNRVVNDSKNSFDGFISYRLNQM